MPSNKELIKTAKAIADELGLEITTDGLNNSQLSDLVKDLRAKQTDAETETQADGAPAADEDRAPAQADGYYIAEGKALTSKKGIVADGDKVDESFFDGGKKVIDHFISTGHIIKK